MRRDSKEYFALWLSRTMMERGIAGGDVARAVDVNDSAVSRWRNGKGTPGLESIMKLATFLKVHPIRLAVTAGLMKSADVGYEALPLPEDTTTQKVVRQQIMNIRGLTQEDRNALLRTIDERFAR